MGTNLAEIVKNYSSRVKKFAAEKSNPIAMVEKVNKVAGVVNSVSYAVQMVAILISSEKRVSTVSYAVGAVAGAINAVTTFKIDSQ
jgi:hypothetical protein